MLLLQVKKLKDSLVRDLLLLGQFELDGLRRDFNEINREVARVKILSFLVQYAYFCFVQVLLCIHVLHFLLVKAGADASEVIKSTDKNTQLTAKKEVEVREVKSRLYSSLIMFLDPV